MGAAAAFLPLLPLLPRQILLLNFPSDIPTMTVAADAVQLQQPTARDVRAIRTFMIVFGLISSVFDILTFVVLRAGCGAGASLFRSGWLATSTATELAVMLVLRTRQPFWRSRPGRPLLWTSALVAAVTVALPFSPLAGPLGLVGPPLRVLAALGALTGA
jgi:Mg2+-importing ATPase